MKIAEVNLHFISKPGFLLTFTLWNTLMIKYGFLPNFKFFNPIRAEGTESACIFFKLLFLHEKRVLEVPNFVTFHNSLKTTRKAKILDFHSVLG